MGLIQNIGSQLNKDNFKISTAESCTGGYISSMLTSIPGSSSYFEGSLIVYSNETKINVLGIEKELIEEHTEVSDQVVRRMAERVREIMKTEYSIATTGYADNNGVGSEQNPPGTVYIAISSSIGTVSKKMTLKDGRVRNVYLASVEALETLLEIIKSRQVV